MRRTRAHVEAAGQVCLCTQAAAQRCAGQGADRELGAPAADVEHGEAATSGASIDGEEEAAPAKPAPPPRRRSASATATGIVLHRLEEAAPSVASRSALVAISGAAQARRTRFGGEGRKTRGRTQHRLRDRADVDGRPPPPAASRWRPLARLDAALDLAQQQTDRIGAQIDDGYRTGWPPPRSRRRRHSSSVRHTTATRPPRGPAEQIPRARQRVGRVRVQALERVRRSDAGDAEPESGAAVRGRAAQCAANTRRRRRS